MAVEVAREQALAERDAFLARHAVETGGLPDFLRRLDDERRRVAIEAVRVRLEPAPLRLLEREGERVEEPVRAQPDVAAAAALDLRLEHGGVLGPHRAVDPVARDDEILRPESVLVGDVGLEHEPDAERLAARLQDVEQALASDPAEAVAARGDRASLEVDVDVVPVAERGEDLRVRLGVGRFQVAERLVREHDPPAEGVVRQVALDDADLVPRVGLLQQEREVQPGGAAPDAEDAHGRLGGARCAPGKRGHPASCF